MEASLKKMSLFPITAKHFFFKKVRKSYFFIEKEGQKMTFINPFYSTVVSELDF